MQLSRSLALFVALKTVSGFTHYISRVGMLAESCEFDAGGLCDDWLSYDMVYTDGTDSCDAVMHSRETHMCTDEVFSTWNCSPFISEGSSEHADFRTHFFSEELANNDTPGTKVGWAEYTTGEKYDMYVHWSGNACFEFFPGPFTTSRSSVEIQWVFGDEGKI